MIIVGVAMAHCQSRHSGNVFFFPYSLFVVPRRGACLDSGLESEAQTRHAA